MTAKKTPAKEVKRDFPMPYVSYYTLLDPEQLPVTFEPPVTHPTPLAEPTKEK